jgi:cob(I)alamin adenosyltransferase
MEGQVEVFCGSGRGKTAAALGICMRAASQGEQAIIVRFLKGKDSNQLEYLKKLEPEIQLFTFEKQNKCYNDLTEAEKEETRNNIRNTVNYTNKIIDACQCDLLVLDEVLGLVELGLIEVEELISFIKKKDDDMQIIFTGRHMPKELEPWVDNIYCIDTEKESKPIQEAES